VKTGPAIVAERLWREFGVGRVIEDELRDRKSGLSVERAVFLTVLHRLFAQGPDRAAEKWKRSQQRDPKAGRSARAAAPIHDLVRFKKMR
jgi:hypothetical protein